MARRGMETAALLSLRASLKFKLDANLCSLGDWSGRDTNHHHSDQIRYRGNCSAGLTDRLVQRFPMKGIENSSATSLGVRIR